MQKSYFDTELTEQEKKEAANNILKIELSFPYGERFFLVKILKSIYDHKPRKLT